ncbi:MAG TPA: hypothetical protein DDW65_19020 [Firmicutes bacterium]|jgi:hypothetical protein|nr:hypothetical protein [Bacillota bacterium]
MAVLRAHGFHRLSYFLSGQELKSRRNLRLPALPLFVPVSRGSSPSWRLSTGNYMMLPMATAFFIREKTHRFSASLPQMSELVFGAKMLKHIQTGNAFINLFEYFFNKWSLRNLQEERWKCRRFHKNWENW